MQTPIEGARFLHDLCRTVQTVASGATARSFALQTRALAQHGPSSALGLQLVACNMRRSSLRVEPCSTVDAWPLDLVPRWHLVGNRHKNFPERELNILLASLMTRNFGVRDAEWSPP